MMPTKRPEVRLPCHKVVGTHVSRPLCKTIFTAKIPHSSCTFCLGHAEPDILVVLVKGDDVLFLAFGQVQDNGSSECVEDKENFRYRRHAVPIYCARPENEIERLKRLKGGKDKNRYEEEKR